jgi:hypothetical protein
MPEGKINRLARVAGSDRPIEAAGAGLAAKSERTGVR